MLHIIIGTNFVWLVTGRIRATVVHLRHWVLLMGYVSLYHHLQSVYDRDILIPPHQTATLSI
jgi:hypothetical protein